MQRMKPQWLIYPTKS